MKVPLLVAAFVVGFAGKVTAQSAPSVYYDQVGDPARNADAEDRAADQDTTGYVWSAPSRQGNTPKLRIGLNLQTFEDNYVGYTFDSDDESFMDFKLSAAYQISAFGGKGRFSLNFAFTGRFAQYIGTRESSPVVGKRFNPYLYLRYNPKGKSPGSWINRARFRAGYAHESNGQSITDSLGFYSAVASLVSSQKTPVSAEQATRQTLDQLSRGWDYIGVSWTQRLLGNHPVSGRKVDGYMLAEVAYRGYLKRGLMQGPREEYAPWERRWATPGIVHRSQVSGLTVAAAYFFVPSSSLKPLAALRMLDHAKVAYTTGSSHTFAHHSILAQAGVRISRLRVAATYTNGYDGDIAQYGKRNHSWGVSFILNSFIDPLSLTNVSR